MTQLDESTRERLTRELQRDLNKPIGQEVDRTMALERTILDQYGRAGAEFLLQRVGLTASFDETCPWRIEGLDATVAVDRVLSPLRDLLPEFIFALEERVKWVIPTRGKDGWTLVYVTERNLYDGRPYYAFIFGGAPNPTPRLSARAESLGWLVPRSLRTLCAVHDGLEESDSGGVLASGRLVDLGEMMDPIAAEQDFQPENYAFQNLLEFAPDGSGNCQAFHRRELDDDDPPTVDWDHETREISDEMSFFEFLDDALLNRVLDEE
jgi:hypothetical protein